MVKYEVMVKRIGELVAEYLKQKVLIIFDEDCPMELKEISITHTKAELQKDVAVGDTVYFKDVPYKVTAVGEQANGNIRKIGHCVFKFDGSSNPELPGYIHVEDKFLPNLFLGDKIRIEGE